MRSGKANVQENGVSVSISRIYSDTDTAISHPFEVVRPIRSARISGMIGIDAGIMGVISRVEGGAGKHTGGRTRKRIIKDIRLVCQFMQVRRYHPF